MVKRVVFAVFRFGVFASLAAMCAQCTTMTTRPVYQRFEFRNGGRGVNDVEVVYGAVTLPRGGRPRSFPYQMLTLSESEVVPIPDTATIRWTSADGLHNEIVAPVRTFIDDIRCFHGFEFRFVDDQLEIYRLKRMYDCTKLLDLERIKVYPP
jgi:hypothetical protein